MKYLIFALSVTSLLFACETTQNLNEAKNGPKSIQEYTFPDDWEGEWVGELLIYSGNSIQQKVEMELHILPIDSSDSYAFTIIYGLDKEKGKRPYEIFAVDTIKGHYKVDEKNSIVLDEYLFGNKMVSRFEVMGNMLLSSYERTAQGILFEIFSGSTKTPTKTGGTSDDIPEVKSYPIKIRQYAVLSKK